MKGLILLAFIVMAIIVIAASYIATARRAKTTPERANVSGVAAPSGRATSPRSDPSDHYVDLIATENEIQLDSARQSGQPVVMAPLVGAGKPTPSEKPPTPPPVKVDRDRTAEVTRRANALRELASRWQALPAQGEVKGRPVSVRQPAALGDRDGSEAVDLGIPALTVLTAVVEVGANTDYPAEMIVRLTGGPAAGAKLLGRTQSTGTQGQATVDRVMMRFERMLWRDRWYDVNAIAVDPGTRIPAVEGDVNRHIVHNVIHEAGAAFLVGYASGTRASNPYVGVTVSSDGTVQSYNPYRTSDLLRATGAETLASSLRDGAYRQPTVTLPAGSAVGIVLIGPVRTIGATALESGRESMPANDGDRNQGVGGGSFRRAAAPSTTYAPDGTPIIVGGGT